MRVLAYGRGAELLKDTWPDVVIHDAVDKGWVVLAVKIGDKIARRQVQATKEAIEAALAEERQFLKDAQWP